MGVDVLLLNTAVADFRGQAFEFTEKLVGPGGLAKCKTVDMPVYTQEQFKAWIEQGKATAGGPGNTAPLIARAGLNVAVDELGRWYVSRFAVGPMGTEQIVASEALHVP